MKGSRKKPQDFCTHPIGQHCHTTTSICKHGFNFWRLKISTAPEGINENKYTSIILLHLVYMI